MLQHSQKIRLFRILIYNVCYFLFRTTGVLYMADSSDNKNLTDTIKNMKRLCPENLIELKGSDIKSKYPETLMYDDNCGVVFDKSGGVLFAHKAVNTIQVRLIFGDY